jgi:Uma2 family endonuclease
MRFIDGPPTFAVEVRSECEYEPGADVDMVEKRADYFAAGTKVVWDVDTKNPDVINVYRPDQPDQPTVYRRGDVAEAEPAVPGWRLGVDELFR